MCLITRLPEKWVPLSSLQCLRSYHMHSPVCFHRSMIPSANRISNGGNPMPPVECVPTRRNFLKGGLGMAVGFSALAVVPVSANAAENAWIVGPQPSYTPEIGTLTSMLALKEEQKQSMAIIKAPPKQPKSVTVQARVEESVKTQ